ncbi:MAG: SUMF1/EgtB/PvdO family nonheme iron enzyme [Planctomycetota bacterium]
MELAYIQEGLFRMGSENVRIGADPVHSVQITQAFWLGMYEVTQKEYEALTGTNPSRFQGDVNPVEMVSWNDAVAFCKTLTDRERNAGRLPEGYEYRLPSEAEWEYAARGGANGSDTEYSGPNTQEELAWHLDNYGDRTHPVAAGKQNALGLYGMSGNVWEWCLDWYDKAYYESSAASDPVGPQTGSLRVCRGGLCFLTFDGFCPAACRDPDPPTNVDDFLGFRVALGPSLR